MLYLRLRLDIVQVILQGLYKSVLLSFYCCLTSRGYLPFKISNENHYNAKLNQRCVFQGLFAIFCVIFFF